MVHGVFLVPATRCPPAALVGKASTSPPATPRKTAPFAMTPPPATPSSRADTPSLKRTYTLLADSNPVSPTSPSDRHDPRTPSKVPALGPASAPEQQRMSLSLKRRYPFCKSHSSPGTTESTQLSAPPSLASLLEGAVAVRDVEMTGCTSSAGAQSRYRSMLASQGPSPQPQPQPLLHPNPHPRPATSRRPASAGAALHHAPHRSISTSASSSTNSSPTTTISTAESATTEDHTTPDTSPDSPSPTMPLGSAFKPTGGYRSNVRELSICPPSPAPGATFARPLSPSKRPRNNKNLSLNLPPQPATPSLSGFGGQTIPEGHERSREPTPRSMSAPSSPAFIPPPPPQNPRRRPSNLGLTIKLPNTLPDKTAVRGSLRHHVSSPSMFSPSRGPPGGMTLPKTASAHQTTFNLGKPPVTRWATESTSSSISSASMSDDESSPGGANNILHEMVEEEEEEPRSGEAKSPAYPDGPMCIFEPNIFLYAEPDAELASQFDVVINVAREVFNPFKKREDIPGTPIAVPPTPGPVPDTACTVDSFMTAYEDAYMSPIDQSRPLSFHQALKQPEVKQPEYVHMPWDHNTPILDDLPQLVNLISNRAAAGKKILVHCQCGVSRSATLLIAYSMFKNPDKSMQDAYSAVKAKSKWIGPNMSLIYQLTDWKKKLTDSATDGLRTGFGGFRGGKPGIAKSATTGGLGRGAGLSGNVAGNRASDPFPEPQTAPLPDNSMPPASAADVLRPQIVRTKSIIDDTPSSAPPGMMTIPKTSFARDNRLSWPDGEARLMSPPPREPSMAPPSPAIPAWVRESEPKYAAPPPRSSADVYSLEKAAFSPPPNMPGRFSPDLSELPSPSNHAATASPRNSGYFGMPGMPGGMSRFFSDPRSPNERSSQSPIVRNIFDVL